MVGKVKGVQTVVSGVLGNSCEVLLIKDDVTPASLSVRLSGMLRTYRQDVYLLKEPIQRIIILKIMVCFRYINEIICVIIIIKILKYKDLTIETQRMWNVKTTVIPVTNGATGTILKSFRKYVGNIPGSHEVGELQKIAILGTAHILRKVLT